MNSSKPPFDIPDLISIATWRVEAKEGGPTDAHATLREIRLRFESTLTEKDDALTFMAGSSQAYVRVFREDDFQTVFTALNLRDKEARGTPFQHIQTGCEADMRQLFELLPGNPVSSLTLRVIQAENLREARRLVQGFIDEAGSILRSMGLARGCLISTIGDRVTDGGSGPVRREIIVAPLGPRAKASSAVWRIADD